MPDQAAGRGRGRAVALGLVFVGFVVATMVGYATAALLYARDRLVSVGIIFLGALYEYTGNVVAPALAHGVYNAVLFVGAYQFLVGAV